jgi:hypothetical protein
MQYPEEHVLPIGPPSYKIAATIHFVNTNDICDSAADIVPDPWWRFCDNRPKLTVGGQLDLKQREPE